MAMALCISCDRISSKKDSQKAPKDTDLIQNSPGGTAQHEDYFDLENFQKLIEEYEAPERNEWQNPQLVVDKLGDIEGKTIADIGAGTGYFTFRLAKNGAEVIAIDIEDQFLDYIEDRKPELIDAIPTDNIETRLAQENDPLLKPAEADIALLVNTYHFLENHRGYLKKIKQGLSPGGKLVIVDFKSGKSPVGPPEDAKVPLHLIGQEITSAGFRMLEVDLTSLEFQYIIVATKK